jgi:hypothetical protein
LHFPYSFIFYIFFLVLYAMISPSSFPFFSCIYIFFIIFSPSLLSLVSHYSFIFLVPTPLVVIQIFLYFISPFSCISLFFCISLSYLIFTSSFSLSYVGIHFPLSSFLFCPLIFLYFIFIVFIMHFPFLYISVPFLFPVS